MRTRVLVTVAVAALVAVAAGCGGTGGVVEGGSAGAGKQLFVDKCGSCHRLNDAGTRGVVGPDLDAAFRHARDEAGGGFDESTIREVVHKQILYPVQNPPTGEPGMPANLVEGEQAESVAAYVASVAGTTPEGAAAGGGATTTAPGTGVGPKQEAKAIFESSCGGCHVFEAAGTSGTVGPNLDESSVTLEEAEQQIAEGGGGMPPFRDELSSDQIRDVAQFIVENRAK